MKTDRRLQLAFIGLCLLVNYVQAQGNTNTGSNRIVTRNTGRGTALNTPCYFPFEYNNGTIKSHSECIFSTPPDGGSDIFWCGTASSVVRNSNPQWGHCPSELCNERSSTQTTGGSNSQGLNCCAKWVYRGDVLDGCRSNLQGQPAGATGPWCGIYNNYDETFAWGLCTNVCPKYLFEDGVAGLQIFGGDEDTNANTKDACESSCLAKATADPDTCTAFAFDSSNNKCWINKEGDSPRSNDGDDTYVTYERKTEQNPGYPNCDPDATTLPPTGCVDTFQLTENKNGAGGQQQRGISTNAACEAACREKLFAECGAYDFNTQTNTCWFFTTEPESLGDFTGVNHYKREQCGDCTDTFTKSEDRNGPGGTRQNSASTEAACKTACLAKSFEECEAYDFNRNDNTCFLFETAPSSLNDANNIDHYRREQCAGTATPTAGSTGTGTGTCVVTYRTEDNTGSRGGNQQASSVNTLQECQDACTDDDNCLALDFAGNQCWLHTNANFENSQFQSDAVTQYIKVPCSTGTPTGTATGTGTGQVCTTTYTKKANTNASGGTQQSGITSRTACEDECDKSSTCKSYDYSTVNNECFFHNKDEQTLMQEGRIGTGVNGVDHYVKTETCGTCLPSQDTFTKEENMNANGGVRESSADTEDECRDYCLSKARDACYGFDFNRASNQCWIHESESNFDNKNQNSNIDLFIRVACGCTEDTFDMFANTNANGATRDSASDTVEECKAKCLSQTNCVGFDFTSSNQCWIHTNADNIAPGNRNTDQSGVDLYVRVPCQGDCPTGDAAFDKYANMNALNGIRDTNQDTQPECRDECLRRGSNCAGYDFNRVSNQCWIHTSASNVETANRRSNSDVDLYVKKPCENCGQFDKFDNTNVNGATRVTDSNINTADKCRTYCLGKSVADCSGFGFNRNSNQCWIHDDDDDLNARLTNNDIDLYVRVCDDSSASPTVSGATGTGGTGGTGTGTGGVICYEESDRRYFGAAEVANADTRQKCEDDCTATSGCVGFGFDSGANRCWKHTSQSDLDGRSNTANNYKTYIRGNCACGYEIEEDKQYFGAVEFTSADTVAECQAECDRDSECVAFGVDGNNNNRCWIHKQASQIESGAKSETRNNYDTHKKGANCPGGTGTPTGTPTGGCVNAYTKEEGQRYFGANVNAASNTESACRSACNANNDCVGYGYHSTANSGSRCWLHTSESDFNSGGTLANYDTYKHDQNCGTGVTGGCTVVYTSENRRYFGAVQNTASNTKDGCEAICNGDSNCVGFALATEPNPDQCWIHTSASDFSGNSNTVNGYTTYKKSESCTTGTGTGGGCVPTYTEFEGSYSIGGTLVTDSGIDTENECKDWCTARSECGAVDFDSQNRCYWHNNGDWQNQLRTGGSGVSQFRKQGCDSSASPTGGTGGTGCVDTYNSMAGKFGAGGARRLNADTVTECESACNSMTRSNCVGFDFNTQDNSCWLHNNANIFNQLQDNSVITNYERIPCTGGGSCQFTRNQNVQSFGATQSPSSSGKAACEARCRAESSCVAYDIDKRNNDCWIHTNAGDLTNTQSNTNFDHYVKDENCDTTGSGGTGTGSTGRTGPTPCAVTYNVERDTLAFNGVRLVSANTEPLCRDACSANRACYGFDFDNNNNQCWQHLNAANNEPSNKESANGVDHYEKDSNCPDQPDRCADTFEASVGRHAYDGTYISTADDVAECQSNCLSNDECLAFDFNGGCYIHTDAANLENLNTGVTGVTHYRRRPNTDPACENRQTTRLTTETCNLLNAYNPPRSNSLHTSYPTFLDQTGGGQTVASCQTLCNGMTECRAFVFNRGGSSCIFFDTVGETRPFSGFDYYRRRDSCDDGGNQPCAPITSRRLNTASNGGVRIPLASTQTQCLMGCIEDNSCAGIDFLESSPLGDRCFQHTSGTIGRTRSDTNSVQIVITQRGCPVSAPPPTVCQMRRQQNAAQDGGQAVMDGTLPLPMSVQECQNRCHSDERCQAVDYNMQFRACFIHYVDGVITSSQGVDHYEKINCPVCFESFTWRQSQRPNVGTGVFVSAVSPTACATACFNNPSCDAFTFQASTSQCRHFISIGRLQTNQITSTSGVDLYEKERCDVVPTAPPTVQPPSTICTKVDYQTLIGYDLFPVPGTPGPLTAPSNRNTAELCRQFCSLTPTCFGVKFLPPTCQYFTHRQLALYQPPNQPVGLVSYRAQCQGDDPLPTLPPTQPPNPETTPAPTLPPDNRCRIAASMASGDAFPNGQLGTGIGQKIPMQRTTANQFNNLSPPFASTWTDIVNPDGCASALHFVCMGVGALSSQGVRVELTGTYNFNTAGGIRSYPISVQRQDTSHRGIDTLDRCLIVQSQSQFSLTLRQGVTYSDGVGFLTGLSVFSLSDWSAADGSNFMVGRRTPFSCTAIPCDIQFRTIDNGLLNPYLVASNSYNRGTDTYTCPSSGSYLFTWTYGGPATSSVSVSLRRVSNTRGTTSWTSARMSTGTTGVDTISKTVIINCRFGERVNLRLEAGSTMSNQYVLTSFSGFKYEPANIPANQRVAWFATMTNDLELQQAPDQLTTLVFDNVEVNEANVYNPVTGQATVPYAGTYLIYASAGVRAGRYVSVYTRRSTAINNPIFGLHRLHTGHNGNDQLGRGVIVTLAQGERVFVNSLQGGAVRGGQSVTSFGGMLLYRN